ncbi:MAG: type III-A CRISPR-associated RAMP protein Csm4 [Coriobacteriia bacterium]|nr:type III-A CRISPR-associated RAMP protein Csm4 [Coriobacteriia bacterium]
MPNQIVKLSFSGPVHFGKRRLADSEYACDAGTLFSALYIEALGMGCADELLNAARTGTLRISDAFPFIGEELYLPKPMVLARHEQAEPKERADSSEKKASKNLKYVPASKMSKLLCGDFDFVGELRNFRLGVPFLRTKVNLTRSTSEDAEPYHVGGYSFFRGNGLYFFCCGSYDIEPLIDALSFSGLGGKRSSGYGQFSYDILDYDPSVLSLGAAGAGKHMLLSTALPNKDELSDELLAGASYRVERKGGFVQSRTHSATPHKKRDMCLFSPGSVFEKRFEGDVFDVNAVPGAHAVYRYARALWMEV